MLYGRLPTTRIGPPRRSAIAPKPGERLVEIGPGLGAMTIPLRQHCDALTVIELDRDLAERLRRRGDLEVVESDVLKVDFGALAERLDPAQFIRIHRSSLVRTDRIVRIRHAAGRGAVVLSTGAEVAVSRRHMGALKAMTRSPCWKASIRKYRN